MLLRNYPAMVLCICYGMSGDDGMLLPGGGASPPTDVPYQEGAQEA